MNTIWKRMLLILINPLLTLSNTKIKQYDKNRMAELIDAKLTGFGGL